ncbi:MAG: cytochrome c nitrite reductase Fe-S protein, partial [Aeromonas sobria]
MSCSRRDFMAGMGAGALIMMTGPVRANTRAGAATLAHSQTIDGVRYGMLHDETACIGCTACMDACREVNKVPEGVSRLEIIRSGPVGEY